MLCPAGPSPRKTRAGGVARECCGPSARPRSLCAWQRVAIQSHLVQVQPGAALCAPGVWSGRALGDAAAHLADA